MRPARAARAVLATALAAVAAVAACGIPTDDEPRALAPTPTTVAAPSSAPADSANSATIYLGSGEAQDPLVSVRRGLDGPPNPERALEALLAGPTDEDLDEGLRTFVPSESALLDATLADDGTLTVNLNEEFYSREGEQAVSAFAQVVLTATALDRVEVESVRFRREGEPIDAFTAGTAGAKPVVTRSDYRSRDPG